jgi:hypothetical protein
VQGLSLDPISEKEWGFVLFQVCEGLSKKAKEDQQGERREDYDINENNNGCLDDNFIWVIADLSISTSTRRGFQMGG